MSILGDDDVQFSTREDAKDAIRKSLTGLKTEAKVELIMRLIECIDGEASYTDIINHCSELRFELL